MALETIQYTNPKTGTSITFGDTSLPNVLYKGITGIGLAPVDNFAVDTAYQPGGQFVRTKKKPLTLAIQLAVLGFDGSGMSARVQLMQTMDTILGVIEPQITLAGTLIKTLADGTQRQLKSVQYVGGFEVKDQAQNYARVDLDLLFQVYDPTWYSSSGYNTSIGSAADIGGFAIPFKLPLTIGGQPNATALLVNHGNIDAHPLITFTGPLSNASLLNGTTNESFAVALNLNAGDSLVFDTNQGTVTYTPNGGVPAPQYTAFGGNKQWIRLIPGNNYLTFARDNPSNNQCSASWSDTWNHG